jgi:hypothetical protein
MRGTVVICDHKAGHTVSMLFCQALAQYYHIELVTIQSVPIPLMYVDELNLTRFMLPQSRLIESLRAPGRLHHFMLSLDAKSLPSPVLDSLIGIQIVRHPFERANHKHTRLKTANSLRLFSHRRSAVARSSFQYHLKTSEKWANRPREIFNRRSYREHLNSLALDDSARALAFDIEMVSRFTIQRQYDVAKMSTRIATVQLEQVERIDRLTMQLVAAALRIKTSVVEASFAKVRSSVYRQHQTNFNRTVLIWPTFIREEHINQLGAFLPDDLFEVLGYARPGGWRGQEGVLQE